jgi:hypothetical protein
VLEFDSGIAVANRLLFMVAHGQRMLVLAFEDESLAFSMYKARTDKPSAGRYKGSWVQDSVKSLALVRSMFSMGRR